jgi:hypothetical protein
MTGWGLGDAPRSIRARLSGLKGRSAIAARRPPAAPDPAASTAPSQADTADRPRPAPDRHAARGAITVAARTHYSKSLRFQGIGAPRGASSYPRRSREELGGRFLGPMAYLEPKGEGNNSMPGKQRSRPGVRSEVLRDPRDMGKATLPESQSPDDATEHPPERRLKPAPCPVSIWQSDRRNLRSMERFPVRESKEMNGDPKSRYYV